jgi:hypothetical protein
MDQRRADVVCDLLLGKASNVRVQLQVTVPATMLMRLDDQPGECAGYGPITPDLAREVAGDATWRRLPSASPPQAGPPLAGVAAESGTVRMDDPEQPDLHPRACRRLMR